MRVVALSVTTALALVAQDVKPEVNAAHRSGLEQYGGKRYAAAVESFRKALETEPEGTSARRETQLLLGESLYLLGRPAEAIAALQQAAQTNEALYMLANSYLKVRDIPRCVAAFAVMFDVPPASSAAHLISAQMMIRQELEDDAEKELLHAIELEPRIPQAHYLLAELNLFHGKIELAISQLKLELAINPDSAMAYYKLGDAYSRQIQWDLAIPVLQKSVWLNPTNSGPYILLGKGYLQRQELSNAEGMLRQAVKLDPRNSSAHYLLGQTLLKSGHPEEGRAMLELSQKLKN